MFDRSKLQIFGIACFLLIQFGLLAVVPASSGAQTPDSGDNRYAHPLAVAYNASGHEIFLKLAEEPGNVVISPLSIGLAMAMAMTGADGPTFSQMHEALTPELEPDAIGEANRTLLDRFNRGISCPLGYVSLRDGSCRSERQDAQFGCPKWATAHDGYCIGDAPSGLAQVAIANALMTTGTDGILPGYASALQADFDADLIKNASVETVNEWVSERTKGKIERVVDKLPNQGATLINAVYFNANWASPFDPEDTEKGDFHVTTSRTVKASMMSIVDYFRYFVDETSGYRVISIPYSSGSLLFIAILPDMMTSMVVIDHHNRLDQILELIGNSQERRVHLSMPKFKNTYSHELSDAFRAIGIVDAFDANMANFSHMSRSELYVDKIIHKTIIEVFEEGTEAVAAAVVSEEPASLPSSPIEFTLDRPFLYFIVDEDSGAVLFEGRLSDPS